MLRTTCPHDLTVAGNAHQADVFYYLNDIMVKLLLELKLLYVSNSELKEIPKELGVIKYWGVGETVDVYYEDESQKNKSGCLNRGLESAGKFEFLNRNITVSKPKYLNQIWCAIAFRYGGDGGICCDLYKGSYSLPYRSMDIHLNEDGFSPPYYGMDIFLNDV